MKNFGVIFDMDGTMLDTQAIFYLAWDFAGENQGYKNLSIHIPNLLGVNEKYSKAYLRNLYPQLDVDTFRREMREYIDKNVVIAFKPGAEKLLTFLKDNGIKMAFTCEEKVNVIRKAESEWLFRLGRYNRPDGVSSESFFEKMGIG